MADRMAESVEQAGPVGGASAEFFGSANGADEQSTHPEDFGMNLEGLAAGPSTHFGGLDTRANGVSQYPYLPDPTVGFLEPRLNEFFPIPQESPFPFGGYSSRLNGPSTISEAPATVFEGQHNPSVFGEEPATAFAGPTAWPNGPLPDQNEFDLGFMLRNFPEIFPELQHIPINPTHFDEHAATRAFFEDIDGMDLPGSRRT